LVSAIQFCRRLLWQRAAGRWAGGDRLAAFGKARVHGAVNILWVKTAYSVEDFARRHLADLQAVAREIIASLPKARR